MSRKVMLACAALALRLGPIFLLAARAPTVFGGVEPQLFLFGTVGLARGQVARLSVSLAEPPLEDVPRPSEDGCVAVLAFVDPGSSPG